MWAGVERLAHYRDNYPKWQPKDWAVLVPRLAGDPLGINLLSSMLTYDPEARISAAQALKHPWFSDLAGSSGSGGVQSSSRAVAVSGAPAGPSAGPLAVQGVRLPDAAAQHGGAAGRPPAMPSLLGTEARAVAQPVQQPVVQLEPAQHSLQQQQGPAQQLLHMPQPPVQLQQPQVQLQQLHLQQQVQLPVQFQHAPIAAAAAATAAASAGTLQAGCRTGQPACMWVSQRPAQHPAPGGRAGAPPTPA